MGHRLVGTPQGAWAPDPQPRAALFWQTSKDTVAVKRFPAGEEMDVAARSGRRQEMAIALRLAAGPGAIDTLAKLS